MGQDEKAHRQASEPWHIRDVFAFFAVTCHIPPDKLIELPIEQIILLGQGISDLLASLLGEGGKATEFDPRKARQVLGDAFEVK